MSEDEHVPPDKYEPYRNVIEKFFDEDHWHYEHIKGGLYRLGFTGENGSYRIYVSADGEADTVRVCVIVQSHFSPQFRSVVAEYLTRANDSLRIGNFEMDFEDGEVRFRVAVDFEDGLFNVSVFRRMLLIAATTADRYYPGLMQVVWSSKSPRDAVYETLHPQEEAWETNPPPQ